MELEVSIRFLSSGGKIISGCREFLCLKVFTKSSRDFDRIRFSVFSILIEKYLSNVFGIGFFPHTYNSTMMISFVYAIRNLFLGHSL